MAGAAIGLLLAGCASREAEQAALAQQALIGMPVETLLACAGVPERRESSGTTEYFSYQNITGARRGSSVSVGAGGGGGNVGLGIGLGFPLGGGGPSGCVANFTLEQGRVSRLVYREDADDAAACYAIVENCLALVPRSR